MQNHVRNTMQFRKRLCNKGNEVMDVLCPSAIKITEKDRKSTFQVFVKKANHLARFDD